MHQKSIVLDSIVLGSSSYGDSDKIITFFTREKGKIRGIAKSVKKLTSKKRPSLEPFTHIKLQITKTNLGIITEVLPVNNFSEIRKNLSSISVAYFLCESIQKSVADESSHPELFDLLLEALTDLELGKPKRKIREQFTKDLLVLLGFVEDSESLIDPLKVFEDVIERKMGSVRIGRMLQ